MLSCAFRDFFSEHFTLEKRVDSMSICIPSVRAREERRGTERRDGEVAPLARLASPPAKGCQRERGREREIEGERKRERDREKKREGERGASHNNSSNPENPQGRQIH